MKKENLVYKKKLEWIKQSHKVSISKQSQGSTEVASTFNLKSYKNKEKNEFFF